MRNYPGTRDDRQRDSALLILLIFVFILSMRLSLKFAPDYLGLAAPLGFVLILAFGIALHQKRQPAKGYVSNGQIVYGGWSKESVPLDEAEVVTVQKRVVRSNKRTRTYYQTLLTVRGADQPVKVFESRDYLSARRAGEQTSKDVRRSLCDEVMGDTRDWTDLDKPFYEVWLAQGRRPQSPVPPLDGLIKTTLDEGLFRAVIPASTTRAQSLVSSCFISGMAAAGVFFVGGGIVGSSYGSFVAAGTFIVLLILTQIAQAESTRPKLLEIGSEGVTYSTHSDHQPQKLTKMARQEIEGMSTRFGKLVLFGDKTALTIALPSDEWGDYFQATLFEMFAR